jgi:hypothetical protein
VNDIGRMDAVIHNAGVFLEPSRATTADGHATTLTHIGHERIVEVRPAPGGCHHDRADGISRHCLSR